MPIQRMETDRDAFVAQDGFDGLQRPVEVPIPEANRAGNRVCLELETNLDHV